MPRRIAPAALLVLLAAGCAPTRYVSVPVGRHQEIPVRMEREGGAGYLVLERPACVALLTIEAPRRSMDEWWRWDYGPVLGPFNARYPLYPELARCFPAGRHRFPLDFTAVYRIPPPTCMREDVPSIEGCHPPGYLNASPRYDPTGDPGPGAAQIFLVSDLPIDPFAVAYEMSWGVLGSNELAVRLADALSARDARATARIVEGLVADVPGSPLWAGVVRMRDTG